MARSAWQTRVSRWVTGFSGALALFAGAAPVPCDAAAVRSGPVVVLVSPHRVFRDVASSIERGLREQDRAFVRIELPKDTKDDADEAEATDRPSAEAGPAETSPASGDADDALRRAAQVKPAVVITVGGPATALAVHHFATAPIVFCMVPNALDALFTADGKPQRADLTGVTTDVAPGDQIDGVVKHHPRCRTLGILHSPNSARTAEAVAKAARERDLTVAVIEAQRDEFPKAIETLNRKQCDGVLMLADAKVYNSANVQRLLLWGIRRKKAVWAFSANIVKAGALAGRYAEYATIAKETAELAGKVLDGADISKLGLQYPRTVQTAVNERTAEMIGLSLDERILQAATVRFGAK